MPENSKLHHFYAAVQALASVYCAVWGTWAYYHPLAHSPTYSRAQLARSEEVGMSLALYIGILVLSVSVALPAISRLVGSFKQRKKKTGDASPSSRLKIFWAHYGAESGPATEVSKEYLIPKIRGDALVGWVSSDLFGPLDPAIGLRKQLRVHYSFDGAEATVTRPEHALLVLPEDAYLREQLETCQREKKLNESQATSDLSRAREFYEQCKAEKKELEKKLEAFTPLQQEAIGLSNEMMSFLQELGPPPTPKYTPDEIRGMPADQARRLNEGNDGDYIESCEYHFGKGTLHLTEEGLYKQLLSHNLRMWPWYEKVAALYEERFKSRVESLKRRFTIDGIDADNLLLPIEGPHGATNLRAIAAKLWELAYKIREKDLPSHEDPRISQGS